ncbi:ATPase [Clostridium sp. MT-14]|uniref:ATPase n=1 Tax=unclassified Clostridium TaxID=2614128 RepID=UPI0012390929|nr:ATPase [Clostridium sp. HV4-5-A1G]KAA8669441.1 ATPase [Clostridium sp. HV4-5-A1G]
MSYKIKHFFTNGNTWGNSDLFLNFIESQKTSKKIFLLKSKSMFLKSFLMKKISEYFIKDGYDMEYYHCPCDENFLHGIIIKKLNIVLLDSSLLKTTSSPLPYEILDLEKNLDKVNFKKYIKKESYITTKIKNALNRSYRFIKAAKLMQEDWEYYNKSAIDYSKLTVTIENLKSKILSRVKVESSGKAKHLFATALTQDGIVSFINTLYDETGNVYVLNGDPGTGKTTTLRKIYKEALKKGLYVEVYHHPFIVDKLEHVIIPELNTAVITSNEINKAQFNGMQIYMNNLIDYSKINKIDLKEDKKNFYLFLNKSLSIMASTKALQYDLQKYFFEDIDSNTLNTACKKLLGRLRKCEK